MLSRILKRIVLRIVIRTIMSLEDLELTNVKRLQFFVTHVIYL